MFDRSYKLLKTGTILCLFLIVSTGCELSEEEAAYHAEIDNWHARRVKRLTSKTGWLSVAGLYWLKEGANTFGSNPENDLKFPKSKTPEYIGSFIFENEKVILRVNEGIEVLHDGKQVEVLQMAPDVSGKPTIVSLDSLNWYIIKRGERYGVRLKDRESKYLKNFEGIERYPVDTDWRIRARLEVYDPPKKIEVPNILGTIAEETSPGALVFEIDGKKFRLDPIGNSADKPLFLIFADQTNGHETYGAGRFTYVPAPDSTGYTYIDFNKAYNPPCAFTRYATCPLPPQQNVLPIEVTAGEKNYGEH